MWKQCFGACVIVAAIAAGNSWAGDSTSFRRLDSADVGYSLPSANRSVVAGHAARADHATNADRAGHAETADRLHGENSDQPQPGYVCGGGGKLPCGTMVSLSPGTYLARCTDGAGEDRITRTITFSIFPPPGNIAHCPNRPYGASGVRGSSISWVRRL